MVQNVTDLLSTSAAAVNITTLNLASTKATVNFQSSPSSQDHNTMTSSYWNMNAVVNGPNYSDFEPASLAETVSLSIVFCIVGFTGILGNSIVIYVITTKPAMRKTVTNLFILNLSIADGLIMLFGIPDLTMFMINKGWLLGEIMCRTQRYVLLFGLYGSVFTLVAVSIERYIAIVHPFRAHMWCSRRRAIITICCIWPAAMTLGVPPALFNEVHQPATNTSVQFCLLNFPGDHEKTYKFYKYLEFFVFYLTPLVLQVILYSVIGKRLFSNTKTLYPRRTFRNVKGREEMRINEAIRARRNVVKMLMVCVIIYFISYSPTEVLLLYNTFAKEPYQQTWPFVVFLMAMAYVNSAANPILYCIFSQNFRREFLKIVCKRRSQEDQQQFHSRSTSLHTLTSPSLIVKMSAVGTRLQSYNTDSKESMKKSRRHTVT